MKNTADKIKKTIPSFFHLFLTKELSKDIKHKVQSEKNKIKCARISDLLCQSNQKINAICEGVFKGFCIHFPSLAQAPDMSEILLEILNGFEKGMYPEINVGGTTESYVMKDCDGFPIAIFKPYNLQWGYDAKKEVAAYRLDHDHFAKVPPTIIATFSHPYFKGDPKQRLGSCQWYVKDSETALHVDRKKIAKVSEASVHRIAILDIRLMNPDRHTSNMLYLNGAEKSELIPIDHGAVLPESLFGTCFAWLHWDQVQTPFTNEELDYIHDLDPLRDAHIITDELRIPAASAENLVGATLLLKEAALRGMSAGDIGHLIARGSRVLNGRRIWEASLLEKIMQEVREKKCHNWELLIEMIKKQVEEKLTLSQKGNK